MQFGFVFKKNLQSLWITSCTGKEVTKNGITELPMDKDEITGYIVINVENIDEAIKIAQSYPMITSTRVYEVILRE